MNPLFIAKLLMYGLLGFAATGMDTRQFVIMLIPVVCIDLLSAIEASR